MGNIKIRPDRLLIFLYVFILLAFPYYADRMYIILNYGSAFLLILYILLNLGRYKHGIRQHFKVVYSYLLWMFTIVILMYMASFWSGNFAASFSKTKIMFFSTLGQVALIIWCTGSKEKLKIFQF